MNRHQMIAPLLLSLVLAALAPAAEAGIYYRAVTTTQGQKGEMAVQGWVSGPQAKIEFEESASPGVPKGGYLLTTDGGKTLYMVDPKEKTYSRFDLEALFATMNQVMEAAGPMLSIDIVDPQVTLLSEESGGALLGLPTRHYRYKTTYDMQMKIMGMNRGNSVESVQDVWTTDALDAEALGVWLRKDRPTGWEGLDRLIQQEMSKARGFPLRTVVETTTTGEKGKRSQTTVAETVVTELDQDRSIPDSTFVIPSDYEEVAMPALGAEQQEGGEEGGNPLQKIFGGG
jgi:hypothetical protein